VNVLAAVALAATAFAATNVDDIFILVGFMSDPSYRIRDVVLGQFFGATVMTLLCFALAMGAVAIAPAYFGLLGLLEIAIGVKQLRDGRDASPPDATTASTKTGGGGNGFRTVTFATIGGFGDNVGVYVPLYAASTLAEAGVFVTVFGAMTGLLCLLGYWLVGRGTLGRRLRVIAARVLPWLLIAVGIGVLSHAGTFALLSFAFG
jgi:cadmium resistance protein CadD (predicted permease)